MRLGHCICCVLHRDAQPMADWGRPPTLVLLDKLVNLEEGMPFSVGPPGAATFCYWSFQRGHLLRIGSPRRDALFYWLPLRRHLFLLVLPEAVASSVIHKGTLCPSSGLGCRIPKMLGPCEGQPQGRGRGQWTLSAAGSREGPWQSSLGDCLPPSSLLSLPRVCSFSVLCR